MPLNGRYQLIRKLATGGMAEVFLARAVGPGGFEKTLVVKRILPHLAEDESFVQMFFAEARIAAQLAHPNLLQIFDFGEDDGSYFIAMEFIDGVNLRTLSKWSIATEPLSPAVAAKLVSFAAEGLAWAHDFANPATGEPMGLVHRDVSPDNIMVSRTGAVKVLDFGVVRIEGQDNRTSAGVLKGKVAYMPREQLRAEVLDRRVDVYALGAVLFLLLTGRRPYERPSEVALMNAILTDDATPILSLRPDLPAPLVAIVERAMSVQRDDRYASCLELHEALERFLSTGQAVTTTQLGQMVTKAQLESPGFPVAKTGTGSRSNAGSAPSTATPALRAQAPLVGEPVVDGAPLDDETPTGITQAFPSVHATPPPAPPRPSAPKPAPSRPRSAMAPPVSPADASARAATGLAPALWSSGPVRSFQPGPPVPSMPATIACVPTRGPSVAVLSRLKADATAERSSILMRKFFPVAARLMEAAPDLAPEVQWHAGAMLDAALVADEHSIVAQLVERIGQSGSQFDTWLVAELSSARIWLQLVERLHRGLPTDTEALEKWVGALGPAATELVLTAIDALEPGPAQELLCRALAPMMSDPSAVITRLDGPTPKNVIALSHLLEICPAAHDRKKVFARLLTRREIGFVGEVMTGRAKARAPETLRQLEVGFGSRTPEIRVRALELMAQLEAPEVAKLLQPLTGAADFDTRPDAERIALWAAIANSRSPSALAAMGALFATKPSILVRKKVVQQRRLIVEALKKATRDEARALLESLAADVNQPDEVRAAAQAGLEQPPRTTERLTPKQASRLRKLVVLDLCSLARAATVTDVMGGQLDGALGRFREVLRLVVTHDGKFELGVGADGVTVNGAIVPLAFGETPVAPEVARLLSACDLRTFKLEGAVPLNELRATLAQLCDPEGTAERAPHVQVTTGSGWVLQPCAAPQPVADAPAAAVALYAGAIAFLKQQRVEVESGKLPTITGAARFVDGWVSTRRAGGARLLAVSAAPPGDRFVVHALNTASIATAFGAHLQLDPTTLRELAELSMFWTLGEEGLSTDPQRTVGIAPPEALRLRLGLIFVSQLKHRRGPSAAVSAFEVGMDRPVSPKVRGPGTVASIIAMAEAWDALALEEGRGHAAALTVLRSRHAKRFQDELFALFVQWVDAQVA